jgi:dTDP-glucose pyrophosphorylase
MNRHIINKNSNLLDALQMLNILSGEVMTLFVVDDEQRMCGTLTDGDIRRALIGGLSPESSVEKAMFKNFRAIHGNTVDSVELLRECRNLGIMLVPRLADDGKIVEIINLKQIHTILPVSAILMAGGKGERLRPMTLTTPKPLLQIDGKAIIDYNIEALAACGINDITVTTRYLAEQLDEHFAKPVAGVQVKCVREDIPLGTIGAAALVERKAEGDTIVMNSDLLTTISFEELYMRHYSTDADVTIAVIPYQVSVPYAILATEGNQVTAIEEKPAYSYYANAGIYVFRNSLLDTLSPDTRVDATDLIEQAIADGRRVTYYPIKGTWIDIGSPVDFKHAGELMRHHRTLTSK